MENDNQNKLEIETQPNGIIQPVYGFITAKTIKKLTYKLNKRAMDGYRPIWDKLEECEGEGFRIPIYNHDLLPDTTPVDENELAIIEALDLAEGHVIETSTSLTDEKNRLLIDTDYTLVNAERAAMDPPRPPVKTAPEKKAWVESMVSEREVDLAEAKRWKKYVEAMARKGELPQRESPWDLKARLKEEEAQAQDEKASQVVPEKVQNQGEAQEAE